MKNQPLNYDEVCAQINNLLTAGEKITVRNVIAKTGGKTAMIANYLKQWHAENNNPVDNDIADEIKQAILLDKNTAIINAVTAYKTQVANLESVLQELSDKISTGEKQIETQNAEIKALNEQSIAKLAVLQAQIDAFNIHRQELKQQLAESQGSLGVAIREKHESAKQAAIWQTKYEQLQGTSDTLITKQPNIKKPYIKK